MERLTSTTSLSNRFVLVDLNFHPALGGEFRNYDRLSNFAEDRRVRLPAKPVVKCMQIGRSDDILQMERL
jgi:hypothetical protein